MSISIELYNKCALFFSIIQLLLFLSYHLHHHQFRRLSLSLSKFLSDGGVVVMFSIFPHFVLRNISLAGCSDVCKTVVNPFSALLDFSGCVLIYCSSVSVFCDLCFPEKKKRALPLSRERELSLPHSQSSFVWMWVVMVVKITALREAKLSSFEKEMYLRLCDFLTAIMFFLSVFLWENATPTNIGIVLPNYLTQSSSSWHSKWTVFHHPACNPDYHR